MIKKIINISSENGLHGKKAVEFISKAEKFNADIKISILWKNELCKEFLGRSANGKSLLDLLSLHIQKNQNIQLCIDGSDEKEACTELLKIINS